MAATGAVTLESATFKMELATACVDTMLVTLKARELRAGLTRLVEQRRCLSAAPENAAKLNNNLRVLGEASPKGAASK